MAQRSVRPFAASVISACRMLAGVHGVPVPEAAGGVEGGVPGDGAESGQAHPTQRPRSRPVSGVLEQPPADSAPLTVLPHVELVHVQPVALDPRGQEPDGRPVLVHHPERSSLKMRAVGVGRGDVGEQVGGYVPANELLRRGELDAGKVGEVGFAGQAYLDGSQPPVTTGVSSRPPHSVHEPS